ncbi:MAG: RNA polymerase sigma factor [Myxococcota bacterium]
MTDETVRAAVGGDARALRTIIDALAPGFHALALRMLGSHADADDATQEALLRVTTRLSTFEGRAHLRTWAYRLAVRSILDFKRGIARHAALRFEDFRLDLADGLEADAATPEDAVLLQQLKMGCGRALLQCLDGDLRVAYVLGEILAIEGPDAAEILEISPATYRKRLSRARARLQDALMAQCGIANASASCRCRRRASRAIELGRLAPADRAGDLDVAKVTRLVRALPVLDRAAAYYQADPRPGPGRALLASVHAALGV